MSQTIKETLYILTMDFYSKFWDSIFALKFQAFRYYNHKNVLEYDDLTIFLRIKTGSSFRPTKYKINVYCIDS